MIREPASPNGDAAASPQETPAEGAEGQPSSPTEHESASSSSDEKSSEQESEHGGGGGGIDFHWDKVLAWCALARSRGVAQERNWC